MNTKIVDAEERVVVYDWLRLVATIFVVIGHSAYITMQTTYGGVNYELPQNLNEFYNSGFLTFCRFLPNWIYGFHMPLFFMLSGAVLGLKPIAAFDTVVSSKIKRLLIPYYIYGLFFMLPVKRLGNFYNNESLKQAFNGFLSGQDSGHLWFLTALFWCILAFVLIKKGLLRFGIESLYAILLISFIIQLTYNDLPFDFLGLKTGLSYLFYFSLGYTFECKRKEACPWNLKKLLSIFILLFALEIFHVRYGLLDSFFAVIIGSFFTYVLSSICSKLFRKTVKSKLWKIVIRNLFYVYLFHDPIEYIILRIFFNTNLLSTAIGCILYTFARTVLVFILSILLGEFINHCKIVYKKSRNLSVKPSI